VTGTPTSPSGFTHWTLWNVCGSTSGGRNVNCGTNKAAFAFQPDVTFGTTQGLPAQFSEHHSFYKLVSKVMFAFFIMAVAMSGFSLLTGLLALFSRLGGAISALFALSAVVFDVIAAALMTVVYVDARNDFRNSGLKATLGVKAFGFTWGSVGLLLIASIGFCCSCLIGRRDRSTTTYQTTTGGRRHWYGRRNKRYDSESTRGALGPANGGGF